MGLSIVPIMPKSMYASLQKNKCHVVKSFRSGKAVYLAYTVCKGTFLKFRRQGSTRKGLAQSLPAICHLEQVARMRI